MYDVSVWSKGQRVQLYAIECVRETKIMYTKWPHLGIFNRAHTYTASTRTHSKPYKITEEAAKSPTAVTASATATYYNGGN